MPTYYLDMEGGNDGLDGLSFANRWKTLNTGASAARLAAGDTVRIMASPPPVNTGINATWTQWNRVVTLASALTTTIENCETVWSAGLIAPTADSTYKKQGSSSAKFAMGSNSSTGRIGHKQLGATLNLTAYDSVTMWIRIEGTTLSDDTYLTLRLCSDTGGTTAVTTLKIGLKNALDGGTGIEAVARWLPITLSVASGNLGSGINSVALYAEKAVANTTIYLDHIVACNKASIHLDSLIGKPNAWGAGGDDSEAWWAIQQIEGTSVTLEYDTNSSPNAMRGYSGATETLALWKRETIKFPPKANANFAHNTLNKAGTLSAGTLNRVTYSFGWNRTDMTTQTDSTWIDGCNGYGIAINTSTTNYIAVERCAVVRCYYGVYLSGTNQIWNIVEGTCCANYGVSFASYGGNTVTINFANANGYYGVSFSACSNTLRAGQVDSNYQYGLSLYGGAVVMGLTNTSICNVRNNGAGAVLSAPGCQLTNVITTNNNSGGISGQQSYRATPMLLKDCQINEGGETTNMTFGFNLRLYSMNHDRVAGNHVIFADSASIATDNTQVHGSATYSWKFTLNQERHTSAPFDMKLAQVFCKANQAVTVSAWFRRSSAVTANGFLICPGGNIAGVLNDVSANMVGGANTWEQVSITFTPTENGVVDIYAAMSGWSSDSLWVCDVSVTGGATVAEALTANFVNRGQPVAPGVTAPAGGGTTVIIIDD